MATATAVAALHRVAFDTRRNTSGDSHDRQAALDLALIDAATEPTSKE